MNKKTVTIIGGSQKQTFTQIGKKMGCKVLFHTGKTRNGGTKREFLPLVKKADCVVLLWGACSHVTMDIVKQLCKEHSIKIVYHRGGASGALTSGLDAMNRAAA